MNKNYLQCTHYVNNEWNDKFNCLKIFLPSENICFRFLLSFLGWKWGKRQVPCLWYSTLIFFHNVEKLLIEKKILLDIRRFQYFINIRTGRSIPIWQKQYCVQSFDVSGEKSLVSKRSLFYRDIDKGTPWLNIW